MLKDIKQLNVSYSSPKLFKDKRKINAGHEDMEG